MRKREMKKAAIIGLIVATTMMNGCTKTIKEPADETTTQTDGTTSGALSTEPTDIGNEANTIDRVLIPKVSIQGEDKKWGYVDAYEGKTFIIPAQYEHAGLFEHGLATVSVGETQGIIDTAGKAIVDVGTYTYLSICMLQGENKPYFIGQVNHYTDAGEMTESYSVLLNPTGQEVDRTQGSSDSILYYPKSKQIVRTNYQDKLAIWDKATNAYVTVDDAARILTQDYGMMEASIESINGDFVPYYDEAMGLYGYKDAQGQTVIEPLYETAGVMSDGAAIVSMADTTKLDEGGNPKILYGVIDTKGQWLIPAAYFYITEVTDGYYAVTSDPSYWTDYREMLADWVPQALYDRTGKALTDFLYYHFDAIGETPEGKALFSAAEGQRMVFLNADGSVNSQLPTLPYYAQAKVNGDVVIIKKDQYDNQNAYMDVYTLEGNSLQTDNLAYVYPDGIRFDTQLNMPYYGTYQMYPKVTITDNNALTEKINQAIHDTFLMDATPDSYAVEGTEIMQTDDATYTINRVGDVADIVMTGYWYGIGAAHGNPYSTELHIDLKTGDAYTLKDLFKADQPWQQTLAEIMAKDYVDQGEDYLYSDGENDAPLSDVFYKEDYPFYLSKEGITIYYSVYEITAYAYGQPSFLIPYTDLKGMMDQDGAFYKSLFN